MNGPVDQHVLVPRGVQAAQIADLWWFYVFVLAVVCAIVWAFVIAAMMRRNIDRKGEAAPGLEEDTIADAGEILEPVAALSAHGEKRRGRWVLGATASTVFVLFLLLVRSVATGSLIANLPMHDAVRIELVGHRWWWSVRYLNDTPANIVNTANELHIPVGRPIELALSSADVIHSFWVPNLAGKRDLVPGHSNVLRFRADVAGTYRGQCAEFCGHAHAHMALLVIAEPEADYQAWLRAQSTTAHEPETPSEQAGQQVFMSRPCVLCHAISGTSAQSNVGPDLTHIASRSTLGAGALPNTRGHLAGWLVNAPNIKPGTSMPSMSLPASELHALVAYLESLR